MQEAGLCREANARRRIRRTLVSYASRHKNVLWRTQPVRLSRVMTRYTRSSRRIFCDIKMKYRVAQICSASCAISSSEEPVTSTFSLFPVNGRLYDT